MSIITQQERPAGEVWASIFGNVLVGVDGSPEALEAARQAATLAAGPVTLLAAYQLTGAAVGAAMAAGPAYLDEGPVREQAEESLAGAAREIEDAPATSKLAKGRPWEALLAEIASARSTLVAVGSHGAGRAKGIVIGSTATELVHKAPCSVLVARKALRPFPSSIVVGVDDSKEARLADAVARTLADRFDASLDRHENVPHPVRSLIEAGMEADLLVVGSRGLHGLRALRSVSERVAHEAKCSVLVVR